MHPVSNTLQKTTYPHLLCYGAAGLVVHVISMVSFQLEPIARAARKNLRMLFTRHFSHKNVYRQRPPHPVFHSL